MTSEYQRTRSANCLESLSITSWRICGADISKPNASSTWVREVSFTFSSHGRSLVPTPIQPLGECRPPTPPSALALTTRCPTSTHPGFGAVCCVRVPSFNVQSDLLRPTVLLWPGGADAKGEIAFMPTIPHSDNEGGCRAILHSPDATTESAPPCSSYPTPDFRFREGSLLTPDIREGSLKAVGN